MINEDNPYLRYSGNGVFWVDVQALVRDTGLFLQPSFRARLLGGRNAITLPELPEIKP